MSEEAGQGVDRSQEKERALMTNPEYTAIMLLIDRSGSMSSIQRSAEDSINEFITGQKGQPGRRTIRVAQFDHHYDDVHRSLPAAECPTFKLAPRGSTALLDSMARSIAEFGEELASLPEDARPGVVVYAVMTDGEENSSREATWAQVQGTVERQEHDYGWQILYLGANQDAIATGAKLGIRRDRSITYSASDAGTRSVIGSVSGYVATASAGRSASFTDEDREAAQR